MLTVPVSLGPGRRPGRRPGGGRRICLLVGAGIAAVITAAFVAPFTAAVTSLQYVDQRMRKEAFDVELMTRAGVPGRDECSPDPPLRPAGDEGARPAAPRAARSRVPPGQRARSGWSTGCAPPRRTASTRPRDAPPLSHLRRHAGRPRSSSARADLARAPAPRPRAGRRPRRCGPARAIDRRADRVRATGRAGARRGPSRRRAGRRLPRAGRCARSSAAGWTRHPAPPPTRCRGAAVGVPRPGAPDVRPGARLFDLVLYGDRPATPRAGRGRAGSRRRAGGRR